MNDYVSNLTLNEAAALIRAAEGPIVVLTHAKPDGDAFGSVIALTAALRIMEREVVACFVPPVPASLLELRGSELAERYDPEAERPKLPPAGLYVVLDTGAWSQVGPLRSTIEPHLDRTLIIDHHLSGDIPARHRYIDGRAAACCEIVAELVDHLLNGLSREDRELCRVMREALFVGIASDTGWFRFSNTRPQTHELAAELLRHGVDHADLYRRLEQTERPQKLALLTRALDSIKLTAGGRAAIMVLRGSDFIETGALEEETERLIDIPQQIGTVQVVVLVSEKRLEGDAGNGLGEARGPGDPGVPGVPGVQTRISFRSKPGPQAVNVADLAAQFGGGGHARAAGAKVDAPVDTVLPRIEQALAAAI